MAHKNHISCPVISRRVNRRLNLRIEALTALILTESIHIGTVCILEIGRCRFCEALRRACSHKRNLDITECEHFIRRKYGISCSQIHKVTGIISAVQLARKLQKTVHSVIKLVVARNREIIADLVHDVDQIAAL